MSIKNEWKLIEKENGIRSEMMRWEEVGGGKGGWRTLLTATTTFFGIIKKR